jgi:hypothetical protein
MVPADRKGPPQPAHHRALAADELVAIEGQAPKGDGAMHIGAPAHEYVHPLS